MTEIIVGLGPHKPPLPIRINGSNPTFRLETSRIEATFVSPLDPVLEDLLEVAAAIFAADGSIARGGQTRPHMGRDWRRTFGFRLPVRNPAFWVRPDVNDALVAAAAFLTDDDYSFEFVQGDQQPSPQGWLGFDAGASVFEADEVVMFSGGLDSLAGALEALETRPGRIALVTHRSAPKMFRRHEELAGHLARRHPGRVLHISVRATRVGLEAAETTQLSRSLLFASLGQVVARMLGARQLSFYENGIVSHNLPISPQVIGTMATRTTHPLTLHLLGQLMDLIGDRPVPIRNPFAWLTKTEVVRKIAEHGGT